MNKILALNNYLKFFPLLLIYLIICLTKQQDILVGDEDDYLLYADKLLQGFYANPSHEYSFLWNGPGYPIFLMFFKFLKLPIIIPKLFNALFIYLGVIFFYKTLIQLINQKKTLYIAYLLGLYYPFLRQALPQLLTEALSFLLVSLFCYFLLTYLNSKNKKYKWLASVTLGYLLLTKIFFAYVVLTLLIISIPFLFHKKTATNTKRYALILLFGFCFTIPYLSYTYSQTNKLLYYGNSGGMSIYWMSTPYQNEFGEWYSFETLNKTPEIYNNHVDFINSIKNLPPVEKDSALKNKAIDNIINNKYKFFKNWISNLGRLFFNYPYSIQEPSNIILIYLIPNSLILICLLITLYIGIKYLKILNPIIHMLGAFSLVFIAGISLLAATPRFLYPIYPILLICISYIFNKFITISISKTE